MKARAATVLLVVGAVLGAGAATASAGTLIAPVGACAGQNRLEASAAAQERAMLCLVNYARTESGLAALEADPALEASAREKTRDILRCDSFSHFACGREFSYWIRANGYMEAECWRAGENLAYGTGSLSTVRAVFRGWMRSPDHRANILGAFSQTGLDVATGTLEGFAGTRIWTQHFGLHC